MGGLNVVFPLVQSDVLFSPGPAPANTEPCAGTRGRASPCSSAHPTGLASLLLSSLHVGQPHSITQPTRLCQQPLAWTTCPCCCEAEYQHQPWVSGSGVEPWQTTAVGAEGPWLLATFGTHQIAAPWTYLSGPSYT